MPRTTIGHVMTDEYDIYIGRGRDPHNGQRHGLGNPYSILADGNSLAQYKCDTIDECCDKYREYVLATPGLLDRLRSELQGKRLACWCTNSKNRHQCHGDVIIDLLDGPDPNGQRWLPSGTEAAPEQPKLIAPVPPVTPVAPPQAVISTKPLKLSQPSVANSTSKEIPMFSEINALLDGHRLVLTINPVTTGRLNVTAAFENSEYVWAPDLVVQGDAANLDTKFLATLKQYLVALGIYQTNLDSVNVAVAAEKGLPAPVSVEELEAPATENVAMIQEALRMDGPTGPVEDVPAPAAEPVRHRRRTKAEMAAVRAAEAAQASGTAPAQEAAPVEVPAPAPAKPTAQVPPTPINGPVRGRPALAVVPVEPVEETVDETVSGEILAEEEVTGATGTDDDFPF